jgi:phosphatidate cytidylyltransferase
MIAEFYSITNYKARLWTKIPGIAGGGYLLISTMLYAGKYCGGEIFLPYLLVIILLVTNELYQKDENPVRNWGLISFAQMYCAGSLSLLCFIPYLRGEQYDPFLVLMIFIFIWLNDSGAFLIGTWRGKHRLFKRISPRKSWEGFWGGFVVVILASLIISRYNTSLTCYEWLAFAVVTVVSATFGDLTESLIKRTFGVKDSGNILPGHGGILDRFDSVTLAAPAVFIFLEIIIRN